MCVRGRSWRSDSGGDTDFLQRSCFLADGDGGPDEDLEAAGRTHAHAQSFAPQRVHVGAILEWSVVHLNEDVRQDELQPQGWEEGGRGGRKEEEEEQQRKVSP